MKKLLCAFFGILVATSSVAEESAWFVGGQLGYSSVTYEFAYSPPRSSSIYGENKTLNAVRYGVLVGRKSFFTENFGIRYYVGANFGSYDGVSSSDYQINLDVAYNFVNVSGVPIGAFAGIGTGYKSYADPLATRFGLIFNINVGVRTTLAEHHGVELFYTHDMAAAPAGESLSYGNSYAAVEYSKPSIFGIRYTYSF